MEKFSEQETSSSEEKGGLFRKIKKAAIIGTAGVALFGAGVEAGKVKGGGSEGVKSVEMSRPETAHDWARQKVYGLIKQFRNLDRDQNYTQEEKEHWKDSYVEGDVAWLVENYQATENHGDDFAETARDARRFVGPETNLAQWTAAVAMLQEAVGAPDRPRASADPDSAQREEIYSRLRTVQQKLIAETGEFYAGRYKESGKK